MSMRLSILKHWMDGNRNGESLMSTVRTITSLRSHIAAKKYIEKVKIEDGYKIIKFKGIQNGLYFPLNLDESAIYGVIVELLNKNHWHCYLTEETNVSDDDIVIDCGAAEGLFSLLVAERCKKVYAVEPLPLFVDSLGKTFEKMDHVQILPYAVSNRPGKAFIKEHPDGVSSSVVSGGGTTEIEVSTIDELFSDKEVTFIKGDLEGYDYATLLGARETVVRNKPKIAITTYHSDDHAGLITKYLKSIVPEYKIRVKGIHHRNGIPVMLHAWV